MCRQQFAYHAIVACVAAGTGIAIVPESVLATVQSAQVVVHPLPKVLGEVTTPLIWCTGEAAASEFVFRELTRKPPARSTRAEVSKAGPLSSFR